MKSVKKVFLCLCIVMCLLGQIGAHVCASVDAMYEAEQFTVILTCDNKMTDLSDVRINVYSAQLAYYDAEAGYSEYAETLEFSVLTDETGSVSFRRPSDSFSITICVDTLPDNYGVIDKHTCFFTPNEKTYNGKIAEIFEVSVTRENDQIFPALSDSKGNTLIAEAEIVQSEQETIDRTSLSIDENNQLVSYNENIQVDVRGRRYVVIDQVEYQYKTLIEKDTFLLSRGFITNEEYNQKIACYLASNTLDEKTINEAMYAQHFVQGEGVSVSGNSDSAETLSTSSTQYVTSDNGYFRVYYDSNDSYDGISMTREIAKNVANEFEAVDTLFCTTWGFQRPYTATITNYYKVIINPELETAASTFSFEGATDYGAETEISCFLAVAIESFKGIIAHEYMHAIMIRYGIKESSNDFLWMHECFATWAGYAYDDQYASFITKYINQFLDSTGYSLQYYSPENVNYSARHYGSGLFAMYIDQQMGGYKTIRDIFASHLSTRDAITTIDIGLQSNNYSLADAFAGCATFNFDATYYYSGAPEDENYQWKLPYDNFKREVPFSTTSNWGISKLACHYHIFDPLPDSYAVLTTTIDFTYLPESSNTRVKSVRITNGGLHYITSGTISSNRCTIVQAEFGGAACKQFAIIPVNGSATKSLSYTMTASAIYLPVHDKIYSFKNVSTGKYMNVHYGLDQNNTNVYQWTKDGSDEQNFRIEVTEDGYYLIRAMCSSNGTNRVLDIVKSGGQVVSGCNVQIYTAVDPDAQEWIFYHVGNGQFRISPRSNTGVALTAYGTSNGSASGTTSTSAGNIYLSAYTGASNQLWELVPVT